MSEKVILLLMGPPGSGKGTQAKILQEKCGFYHISTGDLLREAIARNTPAGQKARPYMEKGLLVPDHILLEILKEELSKDHQRIILDGYPRNINQAKDLDTLIKNKYRVMVIWLDVPEKIVIERISGRALQEKRIDDTSEEIIRTRLGEYHQKTAPLLDFYSAREVAWRVDGTGTIQEVHSRIINILHRELRGCGDPIPGMEPEKRAVP